MTKKADERKKKMLWMRGEKRMTLDEIGRAFKISRQRVFQVIGKTKRGATKA